MDRRPEASSIARACVFMIAGMVPVASGTLLLVTGHTVLYDEAVLPRFVLAAILALAGVTALCLGAAREGTFRVSRSALAWLPLLALLSVGTASGTEPITAFIGAYERWSGLLAWVLYALVFVLAGAVIDTARAMRLLLRWTLAAGSIVAAYGVAQYVGLDPVRWVAGDGRVVSLMRNPNDLAGYLVVVAAAGVTLSVIETGRWRSAALVGTALCAVALAGTLTRSGWIGAAVAVLVVGWSSRAHFRRIPRPAIMLAAGAFVLAVAVLAAGPALRGAQSPLGRATEAGATVEQTLSGRPVVWRTALRAIAERPLQGWGPDALGIVYERFRPADEAYTADDAHDLVLDVALGGGVPAAIVLAVLLVWSVARPTRDALGVGRPAGPQPLLAAPVAAALGYLTYRLVSPGTPATDVLLWLMLGVAQAPYATRVPVRRAAAIAGATVFGLGVLATAIAGGRLLAADSVYAQALVSSGEQRSELAGEAAALAPAVGPYATTAVTSAGNVWVAGVRSGRPALRPDFDEIERRMSRLVARFPGESLNYVNLAKFRQQGALIFNDDSLRTGFREAAAAGLLVDPYDDELKALAAP